MRHRIYVPLEGNAASLWEADATAAGDEQFRIVVGVPRGVRLRYRVGEIVGGVVGILIAFQFVVSARSAGYGFVAGAVVFGFCSVRWGEGAWVMLSKLLVGDD